MSGKTTLPLAALPSMDGPDARLLELGRAFEPAYAKVLALFPEFMRVTNEIEIAMQERWSAVPTRVVRGEKVESYADARRAFRAQLDPDCIEDRFDNAVDAAGAIADEIVEVLEAHTLAGLGVKARVVAFHNEQWWEHGPGDMLLHEFVARDFVETVCAAAGLPHPRKPLPALQS